MKKTFLKFTIASIISLVLAFIAFAILVTWVALHPERASAKETPEDYDLNYENVNFNNSIDNTKLEGWWIPAQNTILDSSNSSYTIIFAHGFGNSRTGMPIKSLKLAKRLTNEGYNVLMFDFRNSGESEGTMTTIGYYEKFDVLSAIAYAKKRGSVEVGLLGWSMGASSSILAANDSEEVKAVIADSPFSDFNSYIDEKFSYWTNLPNKFSSFVVHIGETFMGLDYSKVSPKTAASEMKDNTAVLLIHGKNDNAINYHNSLDIKKKNPNAKLWLINGAGHIRGYKKEKTKYEEKVIKFFNTNLKKKDVSPTWYV